MILDRIAGETGLTASQLWLIIRSADKRYKTYQIPKKRGGVRTISQPSKKLKFIQRWLVRRVFSELPVHDCATAYIKGGGIAKNADAHRNSRYLLKVDFESFFPSITEGDVSNVIVDNRDSIPGITDEDIEIIAKAVCYKSVLTIGAPSSPMISNIMLYNFDSEVKAYCDKNSLKYTRYADDITISATARDSLNAALAFLRKCISNLQYPNLKIREDKTIFVSKKRKRYVTGLVLTTENKISIGRDRKRKIKSLFHDYLKEALSKAEIEQLVGWISFVNSVEPSFNETLKKKYGAEAFEKLISSNLAEVTPKHSGEDG